MGRASRRKRTTTTGRTIQVRNDLTGKLETFHDVRVNDAAVQDWLRERWLSVAAGNPNRPPDIDTPTTRSWIPRPGEEAIAFELGLIEDPARLVAFLRAGHMPGSFRRAEDEEKVALLAILPGDDATATMVRAAMKAAVERTPAGYRARLVLQAEIYGPVRAEEALLPSEADARAWIQRTADHIMDRPVFFDDATTGVRAAMSLAA